MEWCTGHIKSCENTDQILIVVDHNNYIHRSLLLDYGTHNILWCFQTLKHDRYFSMAFNL